MSNFTSGPWHVKGSAHEMRFEICSDDNWQIAVIACTGTLRGDMRDEANARLISAAPKMLAALDNIDRRKLTAEEAAIVTAALRAAIGENVPMANTTVE